MNFPQNNWPNPLALDVNRHYDWGMSSSKSAYGNILEAIERLRHMGVHSSTTANAWDGIWDMTNRSYRTGKLSDNEFDNILSQLYAHN